VYLAIARFVIIYIGTFSVNIAAIRTIRRLRGAFLEHTLRQEVWHFDQQTHGSTATQVTTSKRSSHAAMRQIRQHQAESVLNEIDGQMQTRLTLCCRFCSLTLPGDGEYALLAYVSTPLRAVSLADRNYQMAIVSIRVSPRSWR
jgi:hypothetical protein